VDPDETLFLRVREGDMEAFDRLYERYESRLFAYLRAMLGDRLDAEEVLHDAFMNALRSEPDKLEDGAFRAWLYRIARNLALNRRRDAGRREKKIADAARESGRVAEAADDVLEARQLEVALAAAVRRLPEPLSELYQLRTSGLSYEQIAYVASVPVGTVKSRMHQMVHVLREELKPWIAPE
jgi:RNA polymerase sigma-70 factor, ECF subfamily